MTNTFTFSKIWSPRENKVKYVNLSFIRVQTMKARKQLEGTEGVPFRVTEKVRLRRANHSIDQSEQRNLCLFFFWLVNRAIRNVKRNVRETNEGKNEVSSIYVAKINRVDENGHLTSMCPRQLARARRRINDLSPSLSPSPSFDPVLLVIA